MMPLLDGDDRVVGYALMESRETGNYMRCYLVCDFSTHKLRMYPEEAEFDPDLSKYAPFAEINSQYITKVGVASARPRVLNCLEIVTTTGSHFVSFDSAEERDGWIESIRKASMRQATAKQVMSVQKQQQDVGYKTKVVGGVVHRVPIKGLPDGTENGDGKTHAGGEDGAVGSAGAGVPDGYRRKTRGFPRIFKAGWGIKLGAVMKNWKRRFFVLTEISLGYYKTIEEAEPIKAIPVSEITGVSVSSGGSGNKEATGRENLFEVVTPSRTFFVQVDTKEDMKDWVTIFQQLLHTIKPISSPPPVLSSDSDDDLKATRV